MHVHVYVRWVSTNFWGLIGIYLVHHYVTCKSAEVRVWGRAIWFLGKCREHRWRLSRYQWGSSWTVMDHLRQERLVMQLMQPCSIVWTGHHLIIIILSASRWSSGDCLDQDNHRVDMEGQEHGRENNLNNWPQAILILRANTIWHTMMSLDPHFLLLNCFKQTHFYYKW